ncbi:5-oxoprolinase subunit B family protein [Nocardioides pacificus]
MSVTGGLPARLLAYGDRAVLVELEDTGAVLALVDALMGARPASIGDVVPASVTVLVVAAEGASVVRLRADLGDALARVSAATAPGVSIGVSTGVPADEVQIPVRYDGPDLADVARLTGLDEADVVRAHTGTPWRVAFGGFAPGFGYLVGGDARLRVPRRDSPRTRVPAGAVALADDYSGVYPRASPGGWQLIGSTTAQMWDADREPPALLRPGVTVRFVVAS